MMDVKVLSLVVVLHLVAGFLLVGSVSSKQQVDLVDKNDQRKLKTETIARYFCNKNKQYQIGRISTLKELIAFLSSTNDSEFQQCASDYLLSLRELKSALAAASDDVCGRIKTYELVRYYTMYISKTSESKRLRKAMKLKATPPMAASFFFHYATEVSALCRRSMIENLENEVREQAQHFPEVLPPEPNSEFAKMLDDVRRMSVFHGSSLDALVVWDITSIAYEQRKSAPKMSKVTDLMEAMSSDQSGRVHMHIKMKEVSRLVDVRRKCDRIFRPVYEQLILPVEKLANLGFSGRISGSEASREQQSDIVRHWYLMAQLCETTKHIEAVSDPSMEPNEVKVISRNDALDLEQPTRRSSRYETLAESRVIDFTPKRVSMQSVDLLPSAETTSAAEITNLVARNLEERQKRVQKSMVALVELLQRQMSTNAVKYEIAESATKDGSKVALYARETGLLLLGVAKFIGYFLLSLFGLWLAANKFLALLVKGALKVLYHIGIFVANVYELIFACFFGALCNPFMPELE